LPNGFVVQTYANVARPGFLHVRVEISTPTGDNYDLGPYSWDVAELLSDAGMSPTDVLPFP